MSKSTTVAVFAVSTLAAAAQATYLGPTQYLSFADSPFNGGAYASFYLETFEDGALNTPGVAASGGVVANPDQYTDSVDADDGAIDGSGAAGHSWYSAFQFTSMRFTFDAGALGALPTDAGLVWTDVGFATPSLGFGDVYFEAFDESGVSLGLQGPYLLGDGSAFSSTAEDRFFGATNAGGISAIEISMVGSNDWEVDHLQYGIAPAPGVVPLLAGAFMPVGRRRR